jgi:protein phosphatase
MATSKAPVLSPPPQPAGGPGGPGFDQIEHAGLTDVGVRRSHNQDSHAMLLAGEYEQWRRGGHVFVVADGMGAHAVGELASELAAGIIPHTYHKYAAEGAAAALRKAFGEANASIHARGQQNREFQGMGTTSTALVLRPDGAWVGHVGDSRAYRVRGGRIEQLSFDHSLAWELARRQGLPPEGLEGIPSNVIVRSLGPEAQVQVDVEGPHPVAEGDIYVLCSDGLSNPLSDPEIGAVASVLPAEEAVRFLVDLANLRGGPDNITVLVVQVGGIKAAEDTRPPAAPRRKSWLRRTWPFLCLLVGVVLAAEAVALTAIQAHSNGLLAFVLAACALLLGLGGLAFHAFSERRRSQKEPAAPPPLNIYRQASCQVDRPMLEKLARAEAALVQWVRDKKWEADWAAYQQHHRLAESHARQDNLAAAFREYCRAMRPLTEAMHRQRRKEEVFQPLWDKT